MTANDLPFAKLHGCANDYVVVDAVRHDLVDAAAFARSACDRRTGVGSDGLLLALPSERADLRMRMYNPDGSEAEMCGNGLRCLVLFAAARGLVDGAEDLTVETGAGILRASILTSGTRHATIAVDMGAPRLERGDIPMEGAPGRVVDEALEVEGDELRVTAVSMGNPHVVLFVDDVDSVALDVLGPALERHPTFPRRTNVEVVQVLSRQGVRQRTWERGAGETLACGTGACAVAVAGVLTGRTDKLVTVHLRGGNLEVSWDGEHGVHMTGPAVEVFEGRWPVDRE